MCLYRYHSTWCLAIPRNCELWPRDRESLPWSTANTAPRPRTPSDCSRRVWNRRPTKEHKRKRERKINNCFHRPFMFINYVNFLCESCDIKCVPEWKQMKMRLLSLRTWGRYTCNKMEKSFSCCGFQWWLEINYLDLRFFWFVFKRF